MSQSIIVTRLDAPLPLALREKTPLAAVHETEVKPDVITPTSLLESFTAQWSQLSSELIKMKHSLPRLEIDAPLTHIDTGEATFFNASEYVAHDLGQESAGSDVSAEDSRPSQDSNDPESEALADFYQHSYAIHEAVPSSQLESITFSYTPGTPTYESSDDMLSLTPGTPGGIIRTPSQRRLSQAPRPKQLTSLDDIPNASYLSSIHPQTRTVNLIVGIIHIAPVRRITIRHSGRARHVDLVELTLCDDTKTGFNVSMWLPREMRVNWKDGQMEKPEGARSVLRRSLKLLRPRDIVLLQNVALSSFRGKVHGQSLQGDVTKADLLFRKRSDDDDLQGVYSVQNLRMATGKDSQIMKVKRVRDYLLEYAGDNLRPATGGRGRRNRSPLSEDTL